MNKLLLICAAALSLTACQTFTLSGLFKKKPQPRVATKPITDVQAQGTDPTGFSRTNYLQSNKKIVKHIENGDIQLINEGHRITLIIPTDKYFVFDTPKLSRLKHQPLTDIATLIKCFPNATVHVAGFTDDVGNYEHRRWLSQKRAQAIATYLWTQGINERNIEAEGYGAKYAHANNQLIHGSALNRRIEVQWTR